MRRTIAAMVASSLLVSLVGQAHAAEPTVHRFASAPAPAMTQPIDLDALDLSRAIVVEPELTATETGWLVSVPIAGELRTFELEPARIRSENARFQIQKPGGAIVDIPAPPSTAYRGETIDGRDPLIASATVRDGKVWLLAIEPTAGDPTLHALQPASDAANERRHLLYSGEDVAPIDGLCGLDGLDNPVRGDGGDVVPTGESVDCLFETEIALDADFEYYQLNGSNVAATIADMESIVNASNLIYIRDANITHTIVFNLVRTDINDPYTATGAGDRLNQFRTEWNTNQTGVARDVAHFFTGLDVDGNVIGVAWLSVICSPDFGYGLSQSRFTGNFAARVALTAHELGHNWSVNHCNQDSDCAIMCSGLGGCSGVLTEFNPRSIAAMRGHRDSRSCLTRIDALPGNTQPRAVADAISTAGAIDIDVLANDTDGECDTLTIASFDSVTQLGGTVELLGTGADAVLRYTPASTAFGTDRFNYTITDGVATDSAEVRVTLLIPRQPDAPPFTAPGLDTAYYALPPLSFLPDFNQFTPISTEVVPNVNFPSTNGVFAGSGRSDDVGAVFEGYFIAPSQQVYTFFVESDDGSKLFIGDNLVVDNDGLHGMVDVSGQIALLPGPHRIRIEFFERGGGAGVIFRFQGGPFARQIVPASLLERDDLCRVDYSSPAQPGVPDGVLTGADFFFWLDLFAAGDLSADLSSPTAFGVPDGVLTGADLIWLLDAFQFGC